MVVKTLANSGDTQTQTHVWPSAEGRHLGNAPAPSREAPALETQKTTDGKGVVTSNSDVGEGTAARRGPSLPGRKQNNMEEADGVNVENGMIGNIGGSRTVSTAHNDGQDEGWSPSPCTFTVIDWDQVAGAGIKPCYARLETSLLREGSR